MESSFATLGSGIGAVGNSADDIAGLQCVASSPRTVMLSSPAMAGDFRETIICMATGIAILRAHSKFSLMMAAPIGAIYEGLVALPALRAWKITIALQSRNTLN